MAITQKSSNRTVLEISAVSLLLGGFFTFLLTPAFADEPLPAWDVKLEEGQRRPTTITVQNRCHRTHDFKIGKQNLPFIEFTDQTELKVEGGANAVFPIFFNTHGIEAGLHAGEVHVNCLSCGGEPGCTQDKTVLPVRLTIPAPAPVGAGSPTGMTLADYLAETKDPCTALPKPCEELRQAAWEAESQAAALEASARGARAKADAAEKTAGDLETDAARKTKEAQPPDEGDSWIEDPATGRRLTRVDLQLKRVALREAWDSYRSGEITAEEMEGKWKEMDGLEGADRLREKLEQGLKQKAKEATEATKKANEARGAANAAKQSADTAGNAAGTARAAAGNARRAYEECVSQWRAECARIAAEKKRREEEARKKAEEDRKKAEKEKRDQELAAIRAARQAANAKKRREYREYLLNNIRELSLMPSAVSEVPGLWDELPDILERPVGDFLEETARIPIPTDTLKALGGLYGIASALLDPCNPTGMGRTVMRLGEMTNPRTGGNYQTRDAMKKTEQMCRMLRGLKARIEASRR
ncbi:MAG: hypothetical protein JXR49_20415 [Acidobacteria bacterium]|nr:hypothetical protein [Acidobacteriota bacterium]